MNPFLMTDFYKIGHPFQYPKNTELVYSNFTPRKSRIQNIDKMVVFGLQYFIKEYLIKRFNRDFFNRPKAEVIKEYKRIVKNSLGSDLPSYTHIEAIHDLGYLPIVIKSVPEGTRIPMRVPGITIYNTIKGEQYSWLTNWVESLMSSVIWSPSNSATIAHKYREQQDVVALETGMSPDFVQWQGHDFSFRGMSSFESAMTSGMGHLLSFTGTDTIPSIIAMEEYYNADSDKELIGGSVSATEHSVMCAGGKDTEKETILRLIQEVQPNGIISIVADTWDFFNTIQNTTKDIKEEIMGRDGKVVFRPDSGVPEDILCGTAEFIEHDVEETDDESFEAVKEIVKDYIVQQVRNDTPHGECGETDPKGYFKFNDKVFELTAYISWNRYDKQYYYYDGSEIVNCDEVELSAEEKGAVEILWENFGGTLTDKGYKLLDSHVGLIYGDSITLTRQLEINRRLMLKGFAPQVVFGIGSFTYQFQTRDVFSSAMKATYVEIDGVASEIFKDPKTDTGMKKSAKGLLQVKLVDGEYTLKDQCTWDEEKDSELKEVFRDGQLIKDWTLAEIRQTLRNSK